MVVIYVFLLKSFVIELFLKIVWIVLVSSGVMDKMVSWGKCLFLLIGSVFVMIILWVLQEVSCCVVGLESMLWVVVMIMLLVLLLCSNVIVLVMVLLVLIMLLIRIQVCLVMLLMMWLDIIWLGICGLWVLWMKVRGILFNVLVYFLVMCIWLELGEMIIMLLFGQLFLM